MQVDINIMHVHKYYPNDFGGSLKKFKEQHTTIYFYTVCKLATATSDSNMIHFYISAETKF